MQKKGGNHNLFYCYEHKEQKQTTGTAVYNKSKANQMKFFFTKHYNPITDIIWENRNEKQSYWLFRP